MLRGISRINKNTRDALLFGADYLNTLFFRILNRKTNMTESHR